MLRSERRIAQVQTKIENRYDVVFSQNLLSYLVEEIKSVPEVSRLALITDENVHSLYGSEVLAVL